MLAAVEGGTEKSAAGCMAREGGKKNAAAAYAVCAPMEGERVNAAYTVAFCPRWREKDMLAGCVGSVIAHVCAYVCLGESN